MKVITKKNNYFNVTQEKDDYILKSNQTFNDLKGFLKPDIVNSKVIETATQSEINAYNQRQTFSKTQSFININTYNGKAYFDNMKVKITMQLYGRPQTEVNPIVAEIDILITPLLDKINSGDYYSAITLQLPTPTINEVEILQSEVLTYASGYVTENYQ